MQTATISMFTMQLVYLNCSKKNVCLGTLILLRIVYFSNLLRLSDAHHKAETIRITKAIKYQVVRELNEFWQKSNK